MSTRRNPAPAPLLRGGPRTAPALSGRTAGRRRTTLTALLAHLTPRDLWLLDLLAEHTVLTSTQITTLWNNSHRSTNRRLLTLHRLGLLDSFRPRLERGAAPEHYLLARTAADLLAARHAGTPAAIGWSPDLITRTAYSPTLAHDLGATDFFIALAHRSHQQPQDGRLTSWWSEQRCARSWGDLVRPDARGTVTGPDDSPTVFFLEYDTGTEPHARLAAKLDDYADAATALGPRPLVLFTIHSHRREAHLHQNLADHPALDVIEVATTARDLTAPGQAEHHPADQVWLRLGHPATRRRLTDLPHAAPAPTPESGTGAAAARQAGPPAPHPLGPGQADGQ